MSSFKDLVKKVNEQKKAGSAYTQDQHTDDEEEKKHSSFRDLVKNVNNGTIQVGSKLNSSQVSDWHNGIKSISQDGYSYLSKEGYKAPNTELAEKVDTFLSQATDVGQYIRANKSSFENYEEAYNSYVDTVNYLRDFQKSLKQSNDYYSQWKTEDDYIKGSTETSGERQKRYEENLEKIEKLKAQRTQAASTNVYNPDSNVMIPVFNPNVKKIDDEIAALEAENRMYERGEGGYISKAVDDHSKVTQNSDFVVGSANRNYKNPSREEIELADAMNDNSTWKFDANGVFRDAFGNELAVDETRTWYNPASQQTQVEDKLALYLNTSEDERVAGAMDAYGTRDGMWSSVMTEGFNGAWEYLTEKEKDIYYYYLYESQEKADKYLADMEVELNRRRTLDRNGQWRDAYDESNLLMKIAMNIATVPAKFASTVTGTIDNAVNTLTGNDINPYSMAHGGMHFSQTIRGATAEDLDATGFKIPVIDFTLGDIYQTGMSRLDSALATTVFGGGGTVFLGMGAAQEEAYKLYKQGASAEQITTGAFAAGAAEAIWEYMSYGKLKEIEKVGTPGEWVKSVLIQGYNELLEESATEVSNIITNALVMGSQSDLAELYKENEEDAFRTFLGLVKQTAQAGFGGFLGGIGAGATQSTGVYADTTSQYRDAGRTIMGAEGGVDALKNLANEVAGVSDTKMQKAINKQAGNVSSETAAGKNIVGKTVAAIKNANNATKVGRLYDTVQTANNQANASANKADIAKSLERKGFNTETSNDIAEALVASYNGQELTKAQEKLLKSAKESKVVQDAIANIVTNEQSTMGQRNQNIRSFERGVYEGIISKAINEAAVNNATEKQFTPSGDYAVSKDGKATAMVTEEVEGKTITKDTGEVINIQGIASIRKGEMLLDIGDGKTINSKDVAYATKNDALIYESIASLGDNINAETANKLIGKYKGGNALVFARGIAQAYTYGFYGIDRSELTGKRSLTTELTEDQRNFAYGLGERYRPIKDANDKIEASKKLAKSGKTPSEKGVYYRDKDGNATDISTYLKESNIQLNDLQKTGIEAMRKMSKMMGVRFNVFESWVENGKSYYLDQDGDVVEGNPNGFYDTTTGEIYIDFNAGNDYQGTMLFTIAHEVTHFMRQWSPEHFTKIAKIVFQHGGMKGNVSELVALKQARAKAKGKPISYDVAMEEVVADGMETILKDGKVVEFMADVKKQDHAAWKKLKGWFQNIAKFLRKMVWAYSSQSAQTTEGAMVAEFSQDLLSQIERIFAEGAVASGENYSRVESIVGQINIFLDEIMALDTVATIDSSNETPYAGDLKEDENSGKKVFKEQGGAAVRSGFGRVILGRKGVVNTVFHGNGPAKQAAFPAIKAVIENGIEIGRDINHKGRGYDTVTFAAPIDFFQTKAPLGVVVQVFDNGRGDKSFYIHEIFDAEGNYIELVDGVPTKKEISNTGEVDSSSTAGVADDGNNPNTNIHNDSEIVKSESAEALDLEVDEKTESVAPTVLNSERTWTESDYVQEREQAAKDIAKAIGVSVKKAKDYIDSVNGIAKMIAEDRVRLDYFSSPGRSSFVSNVEYGGSFDFSTLCKKRRLLTGTFTAIQKALPNTALTADEILKIRNRMKDAGLEVSCGLCYVEGSRANMGQFAKEFLKLYKQYYPDAWQPNMADVNTPDGIEWVRINHPECYEQYEYFWNHYGTLKSGDKNLFASQQKPKLYQLHTEYKGEVLDKFKDDNNVEEKNLNGGIRLQSFSDFEIVHLIDTMQIIMDMSRVGLSGQAYTKVPDFAWALGDTGLKINLSLIAKGVDENGKLIFDDVEGMPIAEAMNLRDRYSKNVGTILVAFNDEQLLAAMADDRVDFIIPFHRSQWKKSQYEAMGLPAKTKDYTYMQNEKFIKPQYHEYRGRMVKDKATNYMPNEYWDFSKSGKENAEAYLEMCARNNKRPKFYKLLQNNGDGSYSLKADGSTDGYWKLLIDFKMYDNDGKGSPQMPVKPEFNMDEAQRMLNDYQGGHSNFPVAQGVVDSFVEEYKDSHKGALYSDRDTTPTFYSQMARVVDGVKQEKLGAASVVSMLRGKGVKAEEIKWSGIEAWLEGKKSVTKAELQEFIAGSMLQIEEEVLDNKDRPYTEDQQKRLDEHTEKRDEVAKRLADEWKKITGEEFPIRNVGAGLESAVVNKIIDANLEKKKASFEGRLLEKLKKDVKEVIENNDDFGFDSWMDAIRSIRRHRRDFITHYEMSTSDKAVIVKYCNALNAYNELPNTISEADTAKLRDIAKEADVFNRKIGDVKSEYYAEAAKHMTKWGQYKLKGGDNYREILFKIPGSSYSNTAMDVHWDERGGVLAHARIQDLNTFLGKMLFVEEIQSDWHNEGRKDGYDSDASAVRQKIDELAKQWDDLYEKRLEADAVAVHGINEKMDAIDAERLRLEKKVKFGNLTPDAPFRDTYHEYVLKRLLRMAAEQDYDSIGWTTSQTQVERWSKEFAEAYRIEYDQDIPKFLKKYGKQWDTTVGKTTLDNGTEVWSMAITDSMKESVMTEGQPLYSDRDSDGNQLSKEQQEFFKDSKVRDANGNLLKVFHGTPKKFTTFRQGVAEGWGQGIYFTDNIEAAKEFGENIVEAYLNITNPFNIDTMSYYDLDVESTKAYQNFDKKQWKRWYDEYDTYEEYREDGMGVDIDMIYTEYVDVFNQILRELGYDGIIANQSNNIDGYEIVAFHENQPKLTSNTNPTSSDDMRYQDRADESVSNRSLLANAFEGLAQNDIEKNKIQEYKSKIDLINSEEKKLSELNAQIKELSFAKGPRDTKKIRDLQFEAQQAANRINTYDKQLLRLEASKPLQDVLAREKKLAYKKAEQRGKEALDAYKERVAKTQRELLERWQENRKTAVAKVRETAEKRDAREKLNKLVLDTAKWISYPAKADVKCPDILKQPYTDFLNSIDLSSKRVANGGDPTKNDLRLANAMGSLATALDRIMTAQDPTQDSDKILDTGYLDLPADFVQKLRDMTENIKDMMVEGDYVVNNMTASEVRQLSQMIRTLNHAIKTMSKLYANLRFANIEALGFDTMEFMDALGEIEKTGGMKDFVQWDNALPYYAFKRFGKGGESVFEGLMDAQDKLAFLAKEIFAFQEKTWTGKEAKAWSEDTHTITLPNGNELTLTTADAMSIYCLSRREQGLQHLLGGGTRVIGLQKGSQKAKDSRSMLTIEDVSAIISTLTDRQKQVAEGIQEFMSTVCSEWGNEISMKRFLTRDFAEKHYFPIESNDENLPTKDPAAQQSDLFRLLNISATKPLTPGANNEVIIRNVFDVFTGHASDMARLNAYGMALLDYMKWLNYREKTVTDEGQVNVNGVRKSMEKAFGNAAKSYVLNLVKDVNGRPSDGGDPNILMKWMRAAKTASVGNSLRVATLQITSYPRAALVLSPKNLALGLSKLPQIEKAKKYCGIALWKSFGFYDTNISRSIEDQMKGVTDVKQKLIELSLKGAEWGDAITWGALWNACEYEVASTKKFKVGTEEFYQEVGKKLREVVYKTQVVDSTLTRSQIMRSKRGMAQEAAAFMSEPTLSANILMDAGFEFNMEKRRTGSAKAAWKKTGKYIGRAVAVYAISQLTAALLEGLWDAWRDDEDEEFKEKYIDAFVENLVLDLVPFNKIPIVSDVFEAALAMFGVGFYSSDKMSTTWLTQAVSAVDAWKDALSGESSATIYNALYKTTRAISSYVGVSISGAMREVVAMWNNTAGAYDSTLKVRSWDLSNADLGAELYEAIISGNTRQADSIKAQFEDTDAMHSAIRKALRENDHRIEEAAVASFNGDPSERVRIAKLIIADGFDQDDVVAAINSKVNEMEPDEPKGDPKKKGFYTAEDFATEIANGDKASANAAKEDIIQTAVKNGKTQKEAEEAFISSAKTAFRKMFVAGTLNESKATEALKTYCPTKDGPMDNNDIYWTLREWKYEKSTGSSDDYGKYNDFHTAVQTGKNLKAVIKEYTDHGVEAKTLASQITSYFKPLYKEMSNTERAGIKGYLLNAYQLLGYNRSEKSKDIDKWLKD